MFHFDKLKVLEDGYDKEAAEPGWKLPQGWIYVAGMKMYGSSDDKAIESINGGNEGNCPRGFNYSVRMDLHEGWKSCRETKMS